MACTGRPLQALEDDVRVEGVGAVPTMLQAEMMPSGEKNRVLSLSKIYIVGVLEFGCSWTKCRIGQIGGGGGYAQDIIDIC